MVLPSRFCHLIFSHCQTRATAFASAPRKSTRLFSKTTDSTMPNTHLHSTAQLGGKKKVPMWSYFSCSYALRTMNFICITKKLHEKSRCWSGYQTTADIWAVWPLFFFFKHLEISQNKNNKKPHNFKYGDKKEKESITRREELQNLKLKLQRPALGINNSMGRLQ